MQFNESRLLSLDAIFQTPKDSKSKSKKMRGNFEELVQRNKIQPFFCT